MSEFNFVLVAYQALLIMTYHECSDRYKCSHMAPDTTISN